MKNQLAIAVGLALGLAVGLVAEVSGVSWLLAFTEAVSPVGTAFMNLIRMVVVPLVVVTLFSGVAALSDPKHLGRLGGTTLFFFWITTIIAIVLGIVVMSVALAAAPVSVILPTAEETTRQLPTVIDFLLSLIPANPFAAAADGALLPLIVFTVLFAAAAGTLPARHRDQLVSLSEAISGALIKLVYWVLWTAPLGVFALAAPVAARAGVDVLKNLAVFVIAVIVALAIFTACVYVPVVAVLGRISPKRFLAACIGPQAIAMSTTSTAATLPAALDSATRRLGISPGVAGLVLAIGASLGRGGSALFQGASVVFLAALYGVSFTAPDYGAIILAVFAVSLTVAAVPSASLVTLAPALDVAGVPLAGIAVLFGIDRIPDMFRTAVNETGHLAAATIVEQVAQRYGAPNTPSGTGAGTPD